MSLGRLLTLNIINERRWAQNQKLQRRQLMDKSDPMSLPDSAFITVYRLNKDAFSFVLREIAPFLEHKSIPPSLQLATSLRFLAVGSFQAVIGSDAEISLGRTTVSKVIWKTINAIERNICAHWIKLELNNDEVNASKQYFYEKFRIPGVVGCIDGTHVRLLKPTNDESLFLNRKGFYSINVMIICDYKMRIRYVDACRPGSCHDAFIYKLSAARTYFREKYAGGDRNSWLLADSGYGLESYLLTPYRNVAPGSTQHRFNKKHSQARNVVERTIGNWKSRFRCLQSVSHYSPEKVVKIINVTSALHNVYKNFNANITDEPTTYEIDDFEPPEPPEEVHNVERERQFSIRDDIANALI